jgi:para-nitrobenzyl esterase
LDVSHLGDEFADSGNVGILDIVFALGWVRDNIAEFGGDPDNVTIFGESGGGSKVTCLLGVPHARGLFRHAFGMSGALLRGRTHEEAQHTTDLALARLGVGNDIDALGALDWEALVQAESEIFRSAGSLLGNRPRAGFGPTRGPSLPQDPIDAVRAGNAEGVDVVIGCTTHEGLLVLRSPDIWTGDEEAIRDQIKLLMAEDADQLLTAYREARPDDSLLALLVLMASDRLMRIPHIRFAEALVEGGANTRMYLFDFRQPLMPGMEPLAGHGSDMPYAFDNVHLAPRAQVPGGDEVAVAMSGALVALGRTGDPNHDALPPWPTYLLLDRATMLFDVEPHLERDPMAGERQAWNGIDVGGGLG